MKSGTIPRLIVIGVAAALVAATPAAAQSDSGVHELEIEVGVGYDSNAFLAPEGGYYDQNAQATVDPRTESTLYLPMRIGGSLGLPLGQGRHSFDTRYRLTGDFYPDSATSNAEETYAKVEPGFRFGVGSAGRDRFVQVTPFASYNKEVFFDRDTGFAAATSGVDVSDRYSYTALGGEVELDYEATEAIDLSLQGSVETRRYERVSELESFDHARYRAEAGVAFRLSRRVRWYVDYAYQIRDYDQREAKALDGSSSGDNPSLEYAYQAFGTTLRVRPLRAWTLSLDWEQTQRDDEFVGYNDYTQDGYRFRSTLRSDRGKLRLTVKRWEREFDNAFIFDAPTDVRDGSANPLKYYESLELELHGEIAWKRHLRWFARAELRDQQTTDPRFRYERTQLMTGLKWVD